jgi:hypothetical protein
VWPFLLSTKSFLPKSVTYTLKQRWGKCVILFYIKLTACISTYVVEEISAGDRNAAKQRIDAIQSINLLDVNEEIEALADYLLLGGALPAKARFDALHIACAAYRGVNVVLTWNLKHIANPV